MKLLRGVGVILSFNPIFAVYGGDIFYDIFIDFVRMI